MRRDEPIETEPMAVPRLFLREPGWRVALKVGSVREHCYTIAPGDESYHRLADGEIYVYHGDEKLCVPCAERRGLLSYAPRPLRPPIVLVDRDGDALLQIEPIPTVDPDV